MSSLQNESTHSPRYKGVRLTILRLLCGFKTVREFCEFEGSKLKTKTFFDWENGRNNGVSQVGARKVIDRARVVGLNCIFEWLFYGIGVWPSYDVDAPDIFPGHQASDLAIELQWYQERYPQAVHVIIYDNAMAPEYRVGDMVTGLPQKNINSVIGQTALVHRENGEWLLRHVEAGGKPNTVTLRCTHADFQDKTHNAL